MQSKYNSVQQRAGQTTCHSNDVSFKRRVIQTTCHSNDVLVNSLDTPSHSMSFYQAPQPYQTDIITLTETSEKESNVEIDGYEKFHTA